MNTAWLIISFQYLSLAHRKFYNFMHLFLIAMLRVIDILKFLCYPSLNLPNSGSHQNIAKNSKLSRIFVFKCLKSVDISWSTRCSLAKLGYSFVRRSLIDQQFMLLPEKFPNINVLKRYFLCLTIRFLHSRRPNRTQMLR